MSQKLPRKTSSILTGIGLIALCLTTTHCKSDEKDSADTGSPQQDTADTGEPAPPASDFNTGQYRVTALQLLDGEEGYDLDDDGEINNKLPSILTLVNLFVTDIDISPDGFNSNLTEALESGALVMFIDANHVDGALTYDLLLGTQDEEGDIHLDEDQSYDDQGVPHGRLNGRFTDQTTFTLGPDDIQIPITFYAYEPALMVPLAQGIADGELITESTGGMLGGAVPVDELIDQVVAPMIPEEGYDGKTKEEWLAEMEEMANDDNMSDILLEDGRRAFSAALVFEAEASTW